MAVQPWPWPKEPTPPVRSGSWIARHPTRYTFHADVRATIIKHWESFGILVRPNTYVDHPEGWTRRLGWPTSPRSVDGWGRGGRGAPVGRENGTKALMRIFNDPNPPWIAWCIWRGMIWSPGRGWVRFRDDGTGLHFDHPHITFSPAGINRVIFFDTESGISPEHEMALDFLAAGWDDPREEEFWANRPDDGGKYQKIDGLWVPVEQEAA